MEITVDPLPCSKISRVAFIETSWQIDARFRGWWDFEVWQNFKEIQYVTLNSISGMLASSELQAFDLVQTTDDRATMPADVHACWM